jgi:hypothetical protein
MKVNKPKRIFLKYFTKVFILRLHPEQYEELKRESQKLRCSIASLIRTAVDSFID